MMVGKKKKARLVATWSCPSSCLIRGLLLLLGLNIVLGAGVDRKIWGPNHGKFSGIIIPGLASTRLRSWSMLDCPLSPLDFNPLDPVWLDTKKVLSVPQCWLKCMMLEPFNQTDHPECKARPDSGITAITELDPGLITGTLSSVWKDWITWCIEFGIEPDALVAVPYDWRLAGSVLEKRDLYFHKLRLTFETCRKQKGVPASVFAHSLGNNVFRYFLEWLKHEIPPSQYTTWIDEHIYAYHALGAPFLGSAEALKGMLSGTNFGLPISEGTCRMMIGSFSSGPWMLPFSHNCHAREKVCIKQSNGTIIEDRRVHCNEHEYAQNASGWPVDILRIDMPMTAGVAYPGVPLGSEAMAAMTDRTVPIQRSYSAHKISDGTMFEEIGDFDPEAAIVLYQLKKYYLEDPILNPLTPWERPPIKNVFCIYGVNLKTEVGYELAPSGKPYPDNWIIKDVIYETDGGVLVSRSGEPVQGTPEAFSGDATVPYHSLSWCKRWLGPQVNITRAPQGSHNNYQEMLNVEHDQERDLVPEITRDDKIKYITYYEDAVSLPGKKTAVWELDKLDHRNLVRSPVLMREFWLENLHDNHPAATKPFISKARREPMRDEECYWDYSKARCALLDRCEYRYVFGDVHLTQSCRLKPSEELHILRYI